ncbi:diguanylate cyclase [Pantoea sp.]|uniref:diguanylate cyclase n=1 Tax=Pantoea sp. TaxID=69393 RepID=UPI002899A6A1|nr:diguanylate cyclase [Pantoea sp.]
MSFEMFSTWGETRNRWLTAILMGIICFLLTLFCLKLVATNNHISPLWFSTTLMTILVFRCAPRAVPPILLCCIIATALANALAFGATPTNLYYALLNGVQAVAGGLLLRILLNRRAPLDSLRSWFRFVMAAGIVTPLFGALVALSLLNISGHASSHFFYTWVISEVMGMLALGPVLLLWPSLSRPRPNPWLLESLATLVITLGASYLCLRFMPWPFTCVIVILFWCAVRLPKFEAFLLFFANATLISLLLALQLVSIVVNNSAFLAVSPWLPFLLVLIPSHMMALVMDAFRREKNHIIESETRFRHAMEYSAIGMALVAPQGDWLQVNQSLCRTLGYSAAELEKTTFQQITHPDDLVNDLRQIEKILNGEAESYTLEKRYFRKDGEIVWARLTVSLVRDARQQPLYFISQIIDISELKQSEQVNRRLMERITLANEAGGVGVWEWNLVTNEMNWDKRMYALYDVTQHENPSYELWLSRLNPCERQHAAQTVQQAIQQRSALNLEFRIDLPQGPRYIRSQANRVLSSDGRIERMLGICQDVTPLRALNEALFQEKERMVITLDSIGEAVISTDDKMRVIFMNPVAEKMSGWTQEEAAGCALSEVLRITQGEDGAEIASRLLHQLPTQKTIPDVDEDPVLHNRHSERFDIYYSIAPLKTLAGEDIGAVMVIQDVSESRKLLKNLSYSASHDMLTRLPNRASFEQQLKRLLKDTADSPHQHVLVFMDLDKFKAVNDNAGHAAGDALLRELAELMLRALRSSDFLARLGGDEFGLLLPGCDINQACAVVQRIVEAVNGYRFQWENRVWQVGVSAGLTQIDARNCQSGDVLSQADAACYDAKHSGRGQYTVFDALPTATERQAGRGS